MENEDTGAQEPVEGRDINTILAEFEDKQNKPKEKPAEAGGRMERALDNIERFTEQQTVKENVSSINETVEYILDGDDVKASSLVVKGMLNALADENPKINKAFQSRLEDPQAWEATKKWVKEKIAGELSDDSGISNDIEAAKASVAGQNTEAPDVPEITNDDLNELGDIAFASFKRMVDRGISPGTAFAKVKGK